MTRGDAGVTRGAHKHTALSRRYAIASVAQWIRHRPPKPRIVGSSPTRGTRAELFCEVYGGGNSGQSNENGVYIVESPQDGLFRERFSVFK